VADAPAVGSTGDDFVLTGDTGLIEGFDQVVAVDDGDDGVFCAMPDIGGGEIGVICCSIEWATIVSSLGFKPRRRRRLKT